MFDKIKEILRHDSKHEEELINEIERNDGIEKNDMSSMLLSAYLTIMPIVLLVMAAFILIAYLYVS